MNNLPIFKVKQLRASLEHEGAGEGIGQDVELPQTAEEKYSIGGAVTFG